MVNPTQQAWQTLAAATANVAVQTAATAVAVAGMEAGCQGSPSRCPQRRQLRLRRCWLDGKATPARVQDAQGACCTSPTVLFRSGWQPCVLCRWRGHLHSAAYCQSQGPLRRDSEIQSPAKLGPQGALYRQQTTQLPVYRQSIRHLGKCSYRGLWGASGGGPLRSV